ncbi:hypothetical protein [Gilvibacter sp. SZ-19]|nr:hypothetical protein [Gilvibacter sp. SZ-19]
MATQKQSNAPQNSPAKKAAATRAGAKKAIKRASSKGGINPKGGA